MFKRSMRCIFLLLIFLGAQIIHVYGWEIDQTSSVTSIVDGDTFYIPGDRVRLADVNAAESGNEPRYTQAKNALTSLIGGKTVYLDTDDKSGRDQYGRLIAVVYILHNSTHYLNVNKELLLQGVVDLYDFTNNEFNPSTWTRYVRYANPPPPQTYTLTILTPEGSGSTNPTTGTYTINSEESRQITATPASGWSFDHWTLDGYYAGGSTTLQVTMNSAHNVKAYFRQDTPPPPPPTPQTFALTVIAPDGAGSTNPTTGIHTYDQGTNTQVTTTPASGWSFDHWTLDGVNAGSSNPIKVVMNDDHTIKAVFTPPPSPSPSPTPIQPPPSTTSALTILSEHMPETLVVASILVAMTGLVLALNHNKKTPIGSNPVATPEKTEFKVEAQIDSLKPVPVEPRYYGTDKGRIVEVIAVYDKHDITDIKEHLNLPEETFWKAFYELLRLDELEGADNGTFNVKKETRDQWIRYYESRAN
jgi:hypothetical protein